MDGLFKVWVSAFEIFVAVFRLFKCYMRQILTDSDKFKQVPSAKNGLRSFNVPAECVSVYSSGFPNIKITCGNFLRKAIQKPPNYSM